MANFISEDDIEQALLQRLQHLCSYDALNCFTATPDDLNDGSGRSDKREVDALIRGGVPVEYKAITGPDAGKKVTERLKVIDFDMSAAQAGRNEYVAVTQLWVRDEKEALDAAWPAAFDCNEASRLADAASFNACA